MPIIPVNCVIGNAAARKPSGTAHVFHCDWAILSEAINDLRLAIIAHPVIVSPAGGPNISAFNVQESGNKFDFSFRLGFKIKALNREKRIEEGEALFALAGTFYERLVFGHVPPEGLTLHAGFEELGATPDQTNVEVTFMIESLKITGGRSIGSVLEAFA